MKTGDKVLDRRTGEHVEVLGPSTRHDHLMVQTWRGIDVVHVRELHPLEPESKPAPVTTNTVTVDPATLVTTPTVKKEPKRKAKVQETAAVEPSVGFDANGSPVVDLTPEQEIAAAVSSNTEFNLVNPTSHDLD